MSQQLPSWVIEDDSDSDESLYYFGNIDEYISSDEDDVISEDEEYDKNYLSKSNIQWNNMPMKQTRQARSCNVMKVPGGVTANCIGISSVKEAFELFINEEIKNIIIKHTNFKGNKVYNEKWKQLDAIELDAFMGFAFYFWINATAKIFN